MDVSRIMLADNKVQYLFVDQVSSDVYMYARDIKNVPLRHSSLFSYPRHRRKWASFVPPVLPTTCSGFMPKSVARHVRILRNQALKPWRFMLESGER